jgi:hypothetical protein
MVRLDGLESLGSCFADIFRGRPVHETLPKIEGILGGRTNGVSDVDIQIG